MNTIETIHRLVVPDSNRMNHVSEIFGVYFPMRLEPSIYGITERLSSDYRGGYWEFYSLSNEGFYMAPASEVAFQVCCENGFAGKLSADALGITACLYAYSTLSFSECLFARKCAQQYHWLRDYMLTHPEAAAILRATD